LFLDTLEHCLYGFNQEGTAVIVPVSSYSILYIVVVFVALWTHSIQFSIFRIAQHHKCASEGFKICPHTTSLTFDLSSDQEKLPKNRKNPFSGEKK